MDKPGYIQEEIMVYRQTFWADGKQPTAFVVARLNRLEGRKAKLEMIKAELLWVAEADEKEGASGK